MASKSIQELIPIKDDSSLAFNELFDKLGTLDLTPIIIYLIDNVNSTALPHLAEQFHITGNEGWLLTGNKFEQRQLIKESIKIHKIKGTKAAVKNVLKVLNFEGNIQEWFEYSGEPYHFKIYILLKDRTYNSETFNSLVEMIYEYKNVRSVLEEINIESQFTCKPNWLTYTDAENEVIVG